MSEPCKNCGGVKQQQFGAPLGPCFCEPSEIDRLRAEVASLKEERDKAIRQVDIDWVRRQEITRLTQQLAAANGRVEMLRKALEHIESHTDSTNDGITYEICRAALSNLNEDRDKSDV
jgi:predicted RNase H-like nuclease (RuvC/YqgF family)